MKKVLKQKKKPNSLFSKLDLTLIFLFVLLLPTQLGKHFFFPFSYLSGVRVDYLAPTIYIGDIIILFLTVINFHTLVAIFRKRFVLLFLLLIPNIIFAQSVPVAFYRYIKIIELITLGIIAHKYVLSNKTLLLALLITSLFQFTLSVLQLASKHSLQGIFYLFGERYITLSMPGIAKASLNGIEFLRPYGTFSHPNSMAGFFLLLYIWILIDKRFNRFLFLKYITLLVMSLLVFISFSKVAMITYVILSVYYLFRSTKFSCQFCKWARLVILITVAALFIQAHTDPLTIQKRIELAGNSLKIIFQNPIIGVGMGNYLIAQNQFSSKFSYFFNQPVHNIFLLLFAELGIPLGLFIFYTTYRLIKNLPSIYYLLLTAIFITGMFDHYWLTLQQNFLLIGFIIGVNLKRSV